MKPIASGPLAFCVLVAALLLLVGSPARADVPGDPVAAPAAFRDPPMSVRPKFRWWWGSGLDPKEISAELDAVGDAGFRGGEVSFFGDWGTDAERNEVTAALGTARERGMSLSAARAARPCSHRARSTSDVGSSVGETTGAVGAAAK